MVRILKSDANQFVKAMKQRGNSYTEIFLVTFRSRRKFSNHSKRRKFGIQCFTAQFSDALKVPPLLFGFFFNWVSILSKRLKFLVRTSCLVDCVKWGKLETSKLKRLMRSLLKKIRSAI